MTILAVDTTSEGGSLALLRNGQTIAEVTLRSPDGFAHVLFPAIEQILAHARVRLTEVDCFASATGPGSFTGVRVGLSAAKGLAEATAKPVIGISNLRALSWFGNRALRASILDARRGEIYAAVYNSELEPIAPESVLKFSDWLQSLTNSEYEFIAFAGTPFRTAFEGTRFAHMPFREVECGLAPAVACCAEIDYRKGGCFDAAALDANYVRRSDAELFWKNG